MEYFLGAMCVLVVIIFFALICLDPENWGNKSQTSPFKLPGLPPEYTKVKETPYITKTASGGGKYYVKSQTKHECVKCVKCGVIWYEKSKHNYICRQCGDKVKSNLNKPNTSHLKSN